MSVEVRLKESVFTLKKFPKLMISNDGIIVLFSRYCSGTIIVGSRYKEQGEFSDMWEMCYFKDYHGEVTLKNE